LKIKILLIFIFFFLNLSAFATNIRVIDFQSIVDNNTNLDLLYDQIDKDQISHKKVFTDEELILQNEFKRIDELNLILEPIELEKEVENYNLKLNNFNEMIEKFNAHYESQINNLKNTIINITLAELRNYSQDNKIDLILDSNSYILSNNSINITDIIKDQVNKITIEINFEKY
jgi:hypothetical protein